MIKLNVSAANIAVEEKETLTEGRVGLLCRFSFTAEWDGLAKTAVFDGADSRDVILTEDTVAVPAECLADEGYSLGVGVYGKNAAGDIVIPTVYATVGKIQRSAYPSGKETAAPTPDVVAQIQQAAANAEAMARSVREDADLGKFNGGQGPQGPAGATGPKGDTGAAGEAGGYYTPAVTQPDENTMRFAFTPSKEGMPEVPPKDIAIPGGGGGSGEAGGYYAPSVDNEGNLTWTASKTDMPAVDGANIKGPKGDTGATGAQGPAGATGPAGADGKSAYQYAQDGGFTGTEAEFAAKLAKEIPETLPNPNALTFTGAVTGSYDGSAPVSVKIPEGGSGEAWELIDSVTLSEDVTSVNFNFDTPYKKILFMCQPNVSVSGWKYFSINNGVGIPCANVAISSTHALFIEIGASEKRRYQAKDNRVFARVRTTVEQISKPENGVLDTYDGNLWVDIAGAYFGSKSEMEINSIAMNTAGMCVAGAYFEVWGVKA